MAQPRYKSLVDKFAEDIRNGKLLPGTRLPTHRQLATEHKMSLATASRVYAELENMGLIRGETGRGTFVRELSLPINHGIENPAAADMLDLNFNYPSLPVQAELLRSELKRLSTSGEIESLLRYQPHSGKMHEKMIISHYLKQRNITAEANNIVITSGAQQGIALTLLSLLKPGDVVAVDALSYPGFKLAALAHHLEIVAVPITPLGTDFKKLEALCKQRTIRALYCMPTLHNPMGWVLTLAQRKQLINLARKYHFLLIEDATYSFLVKNPPPAIVTLAPDITYYISGFSKNVASGLRVGFIVAPSKNILSLERAIRVTTWNTPALMTAIVCRWIKEGTVDKLEVLLRKDAKMRQKMVDEVFSGITIIRHPTSYFLWIPLPDETRADQITAALHRLQISVATAEPYATTPHIPHAIRIALASIDLNLLHDALTKIRDVIEYHIDL
ncbi:PLP-dependent aminotransferase family protein [Proteus hauseri]|uniref:aminotransferase-like domain-containing protein n=1 Tax=Proteus hauseri TaxID=183417 RepID=UPI0032DADC80